MERSPQGGPLSPLLANGLLNEVDKEREPCGLSFVGYADDCTVDVGSWRAGPDAMETLKQLYGQSPPAAHQRGEERGGAPARPHIPLVQRLVRKVRRGQTACGLQGPWGDEGASLQDHDPKRWTEHAVRLC